MAIEKQLDWFFKKILFLWLPIAAIVILVNKWRAERAKKVEEVEEEEGIE